MPEEKVTVSLERYETLIETESKYWMLLELLIDTSELTWKNDDLSFDSQTVRDLVKNLTPKAVSDRIAELRKAKGIE